MFPWDIHGPNHGCMQRHVAGTKRNIELINHGVQMLSLGDMRQTMWSWQEHKSLARPHMSCKHVFFFKTKKTNVSREQSLWKSCGIMLLDAYSISYTKWLDLHCRIEPIHECVKKLTLLAHTLLTHTILRKSTALKQSDLQPWFHCDELKVWIIFEN